MTEADLIRRLKDRNDAIENLIAMVELLANQLTDMPPNLRGHIRMMRDRWESAKAFDEQINNYRSCPTAGPIH